MTSEQSTILWRHLGLVEYEPVWRAMRGFTDQRTPATTDEIWTLQHPPVYTLGQAGLAEHVIEPGGIPVIRSDRGGQVTYHGPGQIVVYVLFDLRRGGLGIRSLVQRLELAVIDLLAAHRVRASPRSGAPGVYVEGRKIASLGLRVRHGCSYHGVSLNADMDLEPFRRINPCGYPGLEVTRTTDLGISTETHSLTGDLVGTIAARLNRRVAGAHDGNAASGTQTTGY